MTKDEALKMALEALELYQSKSSVQMFDDAAAAIREVLAQPERPAVQGEPVAWYDPEVMNEDRGISWTPGQFHTAPLFAAAIRARGESK
jgi:hypothetical protein